MINRFLCLLFIATCLFICTFLVQAGSSYVIYFASDRDGNFDIFSGTYPEKGEPLNLTSKNTCADIEPSVSRDGKKVVYTVFMSDGTSQIFIMNSDGSGKKQLTTEPNNRMATFSYDGKKIVFISTRDLNEEVYVMNYDGSKQTRLTFGDPVTQPASYDKPMPPEIEVTRDRDPAFSPDGKKIIFTSYRDGNSDLFLMDSDGKNQKHLTNTTVHYHNIQAVFTPDGKNILWASDRDGDYDLFTMKYGGDGKPKKLTDGGFGSHCPHFSRDGKKIVFCADLQGPSWDIFIMDPDGKNIELLFENFSDDWTPSIY